MRTDKKYIMSLIKKEIHNKNPNAEIILFGSQARQEGNEYSDWDILILLNESNVGVQTEKEYREKLFNVELKTGAAISTFVYSKNDWEMNHTITPLYESIKREGVHL